MEKMLVALRVLAILIAVVPLALAQDEPQGTPVGGRWLRFDNVNDTGNYRVMKFVLPAAEAEMGRSPYVELVCTGEGKLVRARYFADTPLAPNTGDYANYDLPALSPKVLIDKKTRYSPIWDLLGDAKSAGLDKKTIQELFKGSEMRVRYLDKAYNHFLDFFVISGLDPATVRKSCGENGWFK